MLKAVTEPCQPCDAGRPGIHGCRCVAMISPTTLQALRDAATLAASTYANDASMSFAIQQQLRLRLCLHAARAANATAPLVRLAGCARALASLLEHLDICARLHLSRTCHELFGAVSPGPALSFSIPQILRNLWSGTRTLQRKQSDPRVGLLHMLGGLLSRATHEGVALRIRDPLSDGLLDTLEAHLHSLRILDLDFARPSDRFRRRARFSPNADFVTLIWGSADDQAYYSLCERLMAILNTRAAPRLRMLRLSTNFPRRGEAAGTVVAFPAQFLVGAFNLQFLRVTGIALHANTSAGHFDNLVTFDYTPPVAVKSLMYEEIRSILESMPRLETLALSLRAAPEWSVIPRAALGLHHTLRNISLDLNFETSPALAWIYKTLLELITFFSDATEAGALRLTVAARVNTPFVYTSAGVQPGPAMEHLALYSQVDVGHVCCQLRSPSVDMPKLYLNSSYLESADTLSHISELSIPLSYLRDGRAIPTSSPALQRLTFIIDCCAICSGISERPCCELSRWLPQHSKDCRCHGIWPYASSWDCPSLVHVALVCPLDRQARVGPETPSPCDEGCTIDRDLIIFVRAFVSNSDSSRRLQTLTLCGLKSNDTDANALHEITHEIVHAAPDRLVWNSRAADDRMRAWQTAGPASFFDPGFEWPADGEMELCYPPKQCAI